MSHLSSALWPARHPMLPQDNKRSRDDDDFLFEQAGMQRGTVPEGRCGIDAWAVGEPFVAPTPTPWSTQAPAFAPPEPCPSPSPPPTVAATVQEHQHARSQHPPLHYYQQMYGQEPAYTPPPAPAVAPRDNLLGPCPEEDGTVSEVTVVLSWSGRNIIAATTGTEPFGAFAWRVLATAGVTSAGCRMVCRGRELGVGFTAPVRDVLAPGAPLLLIPR